MSPVTSSGTRRPRMVGAVAAIALFVLTACGSAPSPAASQATSAAPSVGLPSVALPSAAPSVAPSVASIPPSAASIAPSGSGGTAVDAAAGLKIGAPYSLSPMPAAMTALFQQQFAASAGAFANDVGFGFRQVSGGKLPAFLVVMKFPDNTVSDPVFAAMTGAMETSMGAALTKTTIEGVDVSSGVSATSGALAIFHVGDHIFFVIAQSKDDSLPVATSLISANK